MFSPIFWKPPVLMARTLEVFDAAHELEDFGMAEEAFWTRDSLAAKFVLDKENSWVFLFEFYDTCFVCSPGAFIA